MDLQNVQVSVIRLPQYRSGQREFTARYPSLSTFFQQLSSLSRGGHNRQQHYANQMVYNGAPAAQLAAQISARLTMTGC